MGNEEKACLVKDIKNLLGGGIVKIEITEQAWCSLLKFAVESYVQHIQNWLLKNQWSSLNGKSLSKNDICFALTQRSFDYELSFSHAYSKQVGLQSRGNYELKKDYITLEQGVQVYEIPPGREVNEVLWLTPSDITHATFSTLGYGAFGAGNGLGNVSMGWAGSSYYQQTGSYYIAPAFDTVLRAADYGLKNRILQADLTYKITAGPNGTKLLHLFSTPNNGNRIGVRKELYKSKVWYHYYDTEDVDPNKCKEDCKDIIKYPSEVPLPKSDYCELNSPSKIWVRKYLTALSKEALGRSRGKFRGKIPIPDAEGEMDYESLLAEGKEEKERLDAELKEWLNELGSDKQMERKASEAENLTKVLSKTPMGIFII
jgi:hypothetical protein